MANRRTEIEKQLAGKMPVPERIRLEKELAGLRGLPEEVLVKPPIEPPIAPPVGVPPPLNLLNQPQCWGISTLKCLRLARRQKWLLRLLKLSPPKTQHHSWKIYIPEPNPSPIMAPIATTSFISASHSIFSPKACLWITS